MLATVAMLWCSATQIREYPALSTETATCSVACSASRVVCPSATRARSRIDNGIDARFDRREDSVEIASVTRSNVVARIGIQTGGPVSHWVFDSAAMSLDGLTDVMDHSAALDHYPDRSTHRSWPPQTLSTVWTLPCPNLDAALAEFTNAGFRLHSLGPADDPSYAVVFKPHPEVPAVLRLDTDAYAAGRRTAYLATAPGSDAPTAAWITESDSVIAANESAPAAGGQPPPGLQFSTWAEDEWGIGRAGMRYRDLLPGRWGGQFIASHIHIPIGGPVPDYVHYHDVDFQLIFCHRGWVRVVYEDQGEPFVLEPGDAILQAPGIRHRVLESSDDLYVVEISSPAEHPTYVEQQLDLPNGITAGRRYGGQDYVHFVFQHAPVKRVGSVAVRSLGLEQATDGRYGTSLLEMSNDPVTIPDLDGSDFALLVVLNGAIVVSPDSADNSRTMQVGESLTFDPSAANPLVSSDHPTAQVLVMRRYRN